MTLLFTKLCRHLCLLVFTLGCAWLQAEDLPQASLNLYVFEAEQAVEDYQVWMDKGIRFNGSDQGAVNFQLSPGEHQLVVNRNGFENAKINLNVSAGEYLEIIVTQYKGNPVSHISLETSKQKKVAGTQAKAISKGEPGMVKGRIISSENQQGVAGARLFFAGFAQEFVTDKDGYFQANVPASQYSVSIVHNSFATQTLDGIEVSPKQTLTKNFELTPAGIALKEFVVVAPFIQGSMSSLVDERKETTVMSDFVGAEQMSKSGDSDAAAALTRVAGLTLIDGKYAVVRGMEDRYTTVLMNGAVMRSPDPNSKSVDLDLFPASILDSIEVQKTYSADAPGAFGGGLIKLRTKSLPEEDFFKIKVSLGGNTTTTGKDVLSQKAGGSDYLGVDDGGRDIPSIVPSGQYNANNDYQFLTDAEQEAVAESFAIRYQTKQEMAQPNMGASIAFGQIFKLWGVDAGYQSYLGYGNKWRYEEGESNTYAAAGDTLLQGNDQDYLKSKFSVDTTLLFNGAVKSDTMTLKSSTSLIRKSYRLTRLNYGYESEGETTINKYNLEWSERELFTQQFNGEHQLFDTTQLQWRYGFTQANLHNPDRISYRYDNFETKTDELYFRDGNTTREFIELNDDSQSMGFDLKSDFKPFNFLSLTLKGGYSFDTLQRDSQLTRFKYNWYSVGNDPVVITSQQNPNDVLSKDNIGPAGFKLSNTTTPSDGYDAQQDITAFYAMFETTWFNDLDVILGARSESFTQTLNTFDRNLGSSIAVNQSTDNVLPSLLATYRVMDGMQIRIAVAETVNRPSMLELSSSSWIDPDSGDAIVGNPRLVEANISHFDARLEFYGTGSNSLSVAYFNKEFTAPIERTLEFSSGADRNITFQNAQSATNSGIEMDFRYDLNSSIAGFVLGLSGNYSLIDSKVILPAGNTEYSDSRAMQGQSPYTVNFMLTAEHDRLGLESALIFNEIGERITEVGQGDVPHVFEEPFSALDFTLSQSLSTGKISMKIKNLLDENRLYTQGGKVYKRYAPGISYDFSYTYNF